MFSSITKSARYTETCLKLLGSVDETVTSEDLGQLYSVLVAHINFFTVGICRVGRKGTAATVFKCLQKNTTFCKGDSLDNLKTATEIAAARGRSKSVRKEKDNYKPRPWYPSRGRGRGNSMGIPRGRPDTGSSFIPADRDDL